MVVRLSWLAALIFGAMLLLPSAGWAKLPLRPCVAAASAGSDPAALFSKPAAFDCVSDQNSFGPGDYWVLMDGFSIAPRADEPLSLALTSVWMGRLDVHVRYADGAIVSQSFDSRAISGILRLGAIIAPALPARDTAVTGVLVKTSGAANLRGLVLAPAIETRSESHRAELVAVALYTAFGGLGVALLVYNFALWLTLRLRFQLFYCAMIAATLGYAFTTSGVPALIWDGIDNNDRLRANYILLSLVATASILFLRNFFEPRVTTPILRFGLDAVCVAMMGTGIAFAALAPFEVKLLDRLYFLSFVAMLGVVIPFLANAWRHRSQFLGLFIAAWAAPLGVTALRALYGMDLVPHSFWLDNGTIIAMGLESLMSSMVIAYRVRLLSDERDLARAEENVARRLAETDALTGLLNRRAFLERAVAGAGERRLMLVDIDHFKSVNDRIGHDGGDEVLAAFAQAFRDWQPDDCLTARLGGEEFALLLPVPVGAAWEPASLLARIRATPMPQGLRITASVGVAQGLLAGEEGWKSLYRAADAALYEAKAAGRDCARRSETRRAA